MNKLILIFLLLIASNISKAQINALTENGRQVKLYSNGTWKYSADSTSNNNDTENQFSQIHTVCHSNFFGKEQ